jgi:hypothetical protein
VGVRKIRNRRSAPLSARLKPSVMISEQKATQRDSAGAGQHKIVLRFHHCRRSSFAAPRYHDAETGK